MTSILTPMPGPLTPLAAAPLLESVAPEATALAGAAPGEAFARMEELVRQYGRMIQAMVRRVGRRAPVHLHEDIQQRVFVSLWKQLRRAQDIAHPTSYIYRTAVRETVRVVREEASRAQEPLEVEGSAAELPAAAGDDPYAALARREKLERIRAAITAIAPERRLAVWAHLSGFEISEIMSRYGWSYQKARNLVARGMADVRQILQEGGLGPARAAAAPPPVRRRVRRTTPESMRASAERVRQAKMRMLKLRGPRLPPPDRARPRTR